MQAAPNDLLDAPDAIRHDSRWWHASESTVPEPAAKKQGDQEQSYERWDRQRCHSQLESEIGQWRAGPIIVVAHSGDKSTVASTSAFVGRMSAHLMVLSSGALYAGFKFGLV
jgi:hypothetical protein